MPSFGKKKEKEDKKEEKEKKEKEKKEKKEQKEKEKKEKKTKKDKKSKKDEEPQTDQQPPTPVEERKQAPVKVASKSQLSEEPKETKIEEPVEEPKKQEIPKEEKIIEKTVPVETKINQENTKREVEYRDPEPKKATQKEPQYEERFKNIALQIEDLKNNFEAKFKSIEEQIEGVESRVTLLETKVSSVETENADRLKFAKESLENEIRTLRDEFEKYKQEEEERRKAVPVVVEKSPEPVKEVLQEKFEPEPPASPPISNGSPAITRSASKVDDDSQDLGDWEQGLPTDAKDIVAKFNLSKKTIWDFGEQTILNGNDVQAITSAIKGAPKEKKVKKLILNLSSQDIRLRASKDLAGALLENPIVENIFISDGRRQAVWTFLSALAEGNYELNSVTLDNLDLQEGWSGPQCAKILSHCNWKEFILQNGKKTSSPLKREDANNIFDQIGFGLASNIYLEKLVLKNLPGIGAGDVSKLIDGIRKCRSLKVLNLSLEDIWDRLRVKVFAEYLLGNHELEEVYLSGIDRASFEITDFTSALEIARIKKLDITPLSLGKERKKGIQLDSSTTEKLRKIAEKNGHMSIYAENERGQSVVLSN